MNKKNKFMVGDLVKRNFMAGVLSQRGLGIIIQHKRYGMEVNTYKIHWAETGEISWEVQRLIERVEKIDDSI